MTQQRRDFNINPIRSIIGLVILIMILMGLYSLAIFIFKILMYATPFLLIATAIIDYSVITGFTNWLKNVYKSNSTTGLILIALSLLGLPFTSLFLFGRAMFRRKVRKLTGQMQEDFDRQQKGTYADFEEIEEDVLELPKQTKVKPPQENDGYADYEDLFDK